MLRSNHPRGFNSRNIRRRQITVTAHYCDFWEYRSHWPLKTVRCQNIAVVCKVRQVLSSVKGFNNKIFGPTEYLYFFIHTSFNYGKQKCTWCSTFYLFWWNLQQYYWTVLLRLNKKFNFSRYYYLIPLLLKIYQNPRYRIGLNYFFFWKKDIVWKICGFNFKSKE